MSPRPVRYGQPPPCCALVLSSGRAHVLLQSARIFDGHRTVVIKRTVSRPVHRSTVHRLESRCSRRRTTTPRPRVCVFVHLCASVVSSHVTSSIIHPHRFANARPCPLRPVRCTPPSLCCCRPAAFARRARNVRYGREQSFLLPTVQPHHLRPQRHHLRAPHRFPSGRSEPLRSDNSRTGSCPAALAALPRIAASSRCPVPCALLAARSTGVLHSGVRECRCFAYAGMC